MRDIILNTTSKKVQYYISWVIFILSGSLLIWLIVLGLTTYGKDTSYNKKKKKGVLNMTYQKFIWVYGIVMVCLFILIIILLISGIL